MATDVTTAQGVAAGQGPETGGHTPERNRYLWQAEHAFRAIWMVGRGRMSWQKVLGGHNPHRASYLPIYVPELPEAGIEAHELRLWRRDFNSFVEELSPAERELLIYQIAGSRWATIFRWRKSRGRFERGNVDERIAELAIRLRQICREVR
jgi:hypothetical protein